MPLPWLLIAGVTGAIAVPLLTRRRASASSQPLRGWQGHAGSLAWNVERSGPSWAWQAENVGASSEPTAALAMTAAVRAFQESGKPEADGNLGIASLSGDVTGWVRPTDDGTGTWRWEINAGATRVATGVGRSRGAAAVQLLVALLPYTDGRA